MRQQKKNKFFTFIFSFMPGAAEMYMGFMKQGVCLLALFLLSFIIPRQLRLYDAELPCVIFVWSASFAAISPCISSCIVGTSRRFAAFR